MSTSAVPVRPGRSGGWFADRPIGVKIGAAVAVLAVVSAAMTVLAVLRIGSLDAAATRINDNVVTLADLADIQRSWQGDRARYTAYPLADPQTRAALLTDLAERRETIEGQLDAYAEVTVNREAFEVFRGHVDQYYVVAEGQLVPAADAGDLVTATALITGPLQDSSDVIMDEYNAMQERRVAAGQADTDEATDITSSATTTLWAALAVGIAVAGALTTLAVRRLVGTVRSVQRSVEALAAGDLTVSPEVRSQDELGRIAAPTIVVSGADDHSTPPEHGELLASRIPDARHVVVPGARHLANVEHAETFNSLLLEHL